MGTGFADSRALANSAGSGAERGETRFVSRVRDLAQARRVLGGFQLRRCRRGRIDDPAIGGLIHLILDVKDDHDREVLNAVEYRQSLLLLTLSQHSER